eukprot:s3182_g7.t1
MGREGYGVEYAMWCYVKRLKVLRDGMLVIDLFIIVCGLAEVVMSEASGNVFVENFSLLRVMRIARIARLLKLFRRFSYLKELRKLLSMATSCMRTLCWSFIFCFMVMTIWAMLMVDLVQPLITELGKAGEFGDCEQCLRAAASTTLPAVQDVEFAGLFCFACVDATRFSKGLMAYRAVNGFFVGGAVLIALYSWAVYGALTEWLIPLGRAVHPDMEAAFVTEKASIYLHALTSATALAIGPFQVIPSFRRTHMFAHRWAGRVYFLCGTIGSVTGGIVAVKAQGGVVGQVGFIP